MAFALTSPAFDAGGPIPRRFTCDGDDVSPALAWADAPDGTRSFALICDDPDAPRRTFAHWGVWDIPSDWSGLDEGFGNRGGGGVAHQAINDFGNAGFGGPCPPTGQGTHHYRFRLLALGTPMLDQPAESDCRSVEEAALPHVLGRAELVGTYER